MAITVPAGVKTSSVSLQMPLRHRYPLASYLGRDMIPVRGTPAFSRTEKSELPLDCALKSRRGFVYSTFILLRANSSLPTCKCCSFGDHVGASQIGRASCRERV